MSKAKQVQVKQDEQVITGNEVDIQLNDIKSVSGKIRYLASINWSRSAIAIKLNKRYQHVRNVLTTPLKKA